MEEAAAVSRLGNHVSIGSGDSVSGGLRIAGVGVAVIFSMHLVVSGFGDVVQGETISSALCFLDCDRLSVNVQDLGCWVTTNCGVHPILMIERDV